MQYVWGHDPRKVNDLYWYQNGRIEPEQVTLYFERIDRPLTETLYKELTNQGFEVISINSKQSPFAKSWHPGHARYIDNIKSMIRLFPLLKMTISNKIDDFPLKTIKLIHSVQYWANFFKDASIRVHMNHSGDAGHIHVVQSLAMSLINGINVRSNYSYTSISALYHSREFHTYFRWGEQPACNTSEKLYSLTTVQTGYLFDYMFHKQKRDQIEQKNIFRIVLFDTTSSSKFLLKFYSAFFDLLSTHKHIHLAIKPKKESLDAVKVLLKEKQLLQDKRIEFLDRSLRPWDSSQKSDFVVCLGINSAGIEVALFGKKCIYWVQDEYYCEQLESNSSSQLVFRNLNELIEVVRNLSFKTNHSTSIGDHNSIIDQIDPWRDGKAALRINDYFKSFLDELEISGNAKESLSKANEEYATKWGKDKITTYRL